MGLFKNDLEKFYELLTKTNKDNNVDFGLIGGKKLIVFGSIDDIDYPDEYMFANGKVYYLEKPIGFYEETEKVDLTDGEIDIEDLEDDDIYEDELDDVEVETKERKHIFRNGLYAIGNGIGGFFGHFGKRKNIEVEDTEVEEEKEEKEETKTEPEKVEEPKKAKKERKHIFRNGLYAIGNGIGGFFGHFGKRKNIEVEDTEVEEEKEETKTEPKKVEKPKKTKKERKHIFRNGLYAIGNGIGGFFGHFGKRKNIEIDEDFDGEYDEEAKESLSKLKSLIRKSDEEAKKSLSKVDSLIRNANNKKDYLKEHDTDNKYNVDRYTKEIKDCISRFNTAFSYYAKAGIVDEFFINDLIDDLKAINESLAYKVNEIKKSESKKTEEEKEEKSIETNSKEDEVEKLIAEIDKIESKLQEKADSNPELAEKIYNEITKITKEEFNVESVDEDTLEKIVESKSLDEIEKMFKEYLNKLNDLYNSLEEKTKEEEQEEIIALPTIVKKDNEFTSIDDTKARFKEYDSRESIEEKIKYYEEFLRTHDLSHPDDQGMKERMEQKLADLKAKYNDGKTADNQNRTEQKAYYTQTSKGIDKAIDRIEKERQLKILQAELEGKTVINLGLAEERAIDAKKADLLRLKKECLERKAKVNKYYEEQAARMTAALKR